VTKIYSFDELLKREKFSTYLLKANSRTLLLDNFFVGSSEHDSLDEQEITISENNDSAIIKFFRINPFV